MTPELMKERLEKALPPGTQALVQDLTGTQDHYRATIISTAFVGKSIIERHSLIYKIFTDEMDTNEVHALSLKTLTPEEAK